jgi:hypothetical protein
MRGLIAIEEAFQLPELAHEARNHAPAGAAADKLAADLVDLHHQRLKYMDEYGVDMEVNSTRILLTEGIVIDRSRSARAVSPFCS